MSRFDEFRARTGEWFEDARRSASRIDWESDRVKRMAILAGIVVVVLIGVGIWSLVSGESSKRSSPSGPRASATLRAGMVELDRTLRMDEGFAGLSASAQRRGGWRVVVQGQVDSEEDLDRLRELLFTLLPDTTHEIDVQVVPPLEDDGMP